jgi:integrase
MERGNVYKTGKKQVWYGRFRIDQRSPDGSISRRFRKVRLDPVSEIPTKAAAREALSRHMSLPSKPTTSMTFQDLVERWRQLVAPTLKSSTAQHHQIALRSLLPVFGPHEIASITRYDVQQFISESSIRYSRNTLHTFKTAFSNVFEWAILNGWLEESPSTKLKLPRDEKCGGRRVQRRVLTTTEVNAIIDRLEEPYATLVMFLAVTGLRLGEAVGIKWSDFKGDLLHVQRRIFEGTVGTVKSKKSNRRLPIPQSVLERMRALGEGEWVFRSSTGSLVNPQNALRSISVPASRASGFRSAGGMIFATR